MRRLLVGVVLLMALISAGVSCGGEETEQVTETKDLTILESEMTTEDLNLGLPESEPAPYSVVTGVAKNTGNVPLYNLVIEVKFYDGSGNLLWEGSDGFFHLELGEIANFEVSTLGGIASSYEISWKLAVT